MRKLLTLTVTLLASLAQAGGASDPLTPFYTFIRMQPQDVAIQIVDISKERSRQDVLSWNAKQPMPLASSMKIVVLAAYARAVAAGRLDPNASVTLAEWEQFYLPGTDGGAHANSLQALKIPADKSGRAQDSQKTVSLDALARFMVETSDNAATDALLNRLGKNAVTDTSAALGLRQQGDIGPIAGMFTAWEKEGKKYLLLSPGERRERDWYWAEQVRHMPALRQPAPLNRQVSPAELAQAMALANRTPPLGSAGEYASLMASVLTGQGFAPAELAVMRRHLGWPLRANPANRTVFTALYAKGGSLGAGVLTNNFALEFKNGNRVVYSIMFRNIPLDLYAGFSHGLEDFMLATLTDPKAQEKLLEALGH